MKEVTWTFDARRALRKLPAEVRADIEAELGRFAQTGTGNVKRLTGRSGARLRVGAVAEQAGLRQGYIADIEARRKTGSAASLKAIAAALGVPLGLLVG